MKLSQMQGTIEQRVCLFGPPESGKTKLAAMLAEHYKLLVFDLENGSTTMSQIPKEWQDRVEIIKIRDSRVYPIAIETMMKVVKGDAVNICVAHSKVACPICTKAGAPVDRVCLNEIGLDTIVIVDSMTQLTNSGIAHITKNQPDDYKLQLDDWGCLKVLMDKFLSQIQVARYHVVCITHEEEVKFEDGRTKIVPVAGSANSSRNTAKYFDHICYCNLVNKKHIVASATDYSTNVLTGSRSNIRMEDAKVATLLDVFTNWKLPNFGMPIAVASESVDPNFVTINSITREDIATHTKVVIQAHESAAAATAEMRTPSQIALENLKNRPKITR